MNIHPSLLPPGTVLRYVGSQGTEYRLQIKRRDHKNHGWEASNLDANIALATIYKDTELDNEFEVIELPDGYRAPAEVPAVVGFAPAAVGPDPAVDNLVTQIIELLEPWFPKPMVHRADLVQLVDEVSKRVKSS